MSGAGSAAVAVLGDPERAARRAGRALEQRLARRLVERRERRLEQLAHEREREVALQLRRARGQHPHAGCAAALAGGLQQPRLAEPGGRLDHREAACAGARLGDQRVELGQLPLALQQLAHAVDAIVPVVNLVSAGNPRRPPARGRRSSEEGSSGGYFVHGMLPVFTVLAGESGVSWR